MAMNTLAQELLDLLNRYWATLLSSAHVDHRLADIEPILGIAVAFNVAYLFFAPGPSSATDLNYYKALNRAAGFSYRWCQRLAAHEYQKRVSKTRTTCA